MKNLLGLCVLSLALLVVLSGCQTVTLTPVPATETASPVPATQEPTAAPATVVTIEAPSATPVPPASPTAEVAATPEPEATATEEPAVGAGFGPVVDIQPTLTPIPDSDRVPVRDLPLRQPGYYVSPTFGYWLQFPEAWYTGFGTRPVLVSFTNLNPGTHNRDSMRTDGCLVEINATVNVYGFSLIDLASQVARGVQFSEQFSLGGEPAVRFRRSSADNSFESEFVYVQHDGRWLLITSEYARGAADICVPAWEGVLASWTWFEPSFAVYTNPAFGYGISFPRRWFRFNEREEGLTVSSIDPTDVTDWQSFLQEAMVVDLQVYQNQAGMILKQWLAEQDWDVDFADDISVNGLVGVRVIREGQVPGTQEMRGYFQGPAGRVYEITCAYSEERQWEFRPVANAIIYSFGF